jgi:hypothetical protein
MPGGQNTIQLVLLSIMNCDVRRVTFQLHKCSKAAWRPDSARTRWASSQRSLRPPSWLWGPLRDGKAREKGGEGRKGREGRMGREGKKEMDGRKERGETKEGREGRKERKEKGGCRFSPSRTLNFPSAEGSRINTGRL